MKGRSSVLLFLSTLLILVVLTLEIQNAQGQSGERQVVTAQTTGPYHAYLPAVLNIPVSVPLVSTSMYMANVDAQAVYNEGCKIGQRDLSMDGKQDTVVVLAFGYPQYYGNGVYGTRGYANPPKPMTTAQIAAVVENFGYGYWYCVGADFDSHLRIAIGTSNYLGDSYSSVNAGHGKAWGAMVNDVNNWFKSTCTRSCDGQVDAVGASDIEQGTDWGSPGPSVDWVNGYLSGTSYPLYNFGSADGCPYFNSPNLPCNFGLVNASYVMGGAPNVFPMPEIYLTNGVHAQQWYLMSVYSYTHQGKKFQFIGPMTEYQACQQEGGCPYIDNKPETAWHQLYDLLNGDPRTSGELLPYLTDILWFGRY